MKYEVSNSLKKLYLIFNQKIKSPPMRARLFLFSNLSSKNSKQLLEVPSYKLCVREATVNRKVDLTMLFSF